MLLPFTQQEDMPSSTGNKLAIVNNNTHQVEKLFDPTLSNADPVHGAGERARLQGQPSQVFTDAGPIVFAWDRPLGEVTVAASRTAGAFTGIGDGAEVELAVIQGGAGSNLITWDASVNWGSAGAPTLSTAAGDIDRFTFRRRGSEFLGRVIGLGY